MTDIQRIIAAAGATLLLLPVMCAEGATRAIIVAQADSSVCEGGPDRPSTLQLISAGIGRCPEEGRLVGYVRFDISSVPRSKLLETVSVNEAELRLMAMSFGLASRDERFFVTVSHCAPEHWDEVSLTWNTRVCVETAIGEDSVIVSGLDLPRTYLWNVTRAVDTARSEGAASLTFVINAFKLEYIPREIVPGQKYGPEESVGFVRFWTKERVEFGLGAVPTLMVSHSRSPTAVMEFLGYTFAVLSALGVSIGLYQAVKKTWARTKVT